MHLRLGLLSGLIALAVAVWPATAGAGTVSATEGQPFSGQVATVTVSCGNPSSPQGTIIWGDAGSSPSTAQITVSGSQLLISGSHTYLEEGSYNGSVSGSFACGSDHVPFSASFSAQVADAPLGGFPGSTLTASATDHSFSGAVASFEDAGGSAGVSDYTATIDWGDGSTSVGTVTTHSCPTCILSYVVSGSHQYGTAAKTYSVTVTITDENGASTVVTDTMVVANKLLCPALKWSGPPNPDIGNEYELSNPQPGPSGESSQTLWILTRTAVAVTPECWYAVGGIGPESAQGHPTIKFLTYSGVALNGVYFIPESPDSALVLGSDGTMVASNFCGLRPIKGTRAPAARARGTSCNSSTYYDVEVPENGGQGGPLTLLGRVDLRAHPITDFGYSLGSFEPAPGGPQIGSHTINPGATITNLPYPSAYAAEVDAAINLPGEFSLSASTGAPDAATQADQVTSQLTYDTQGPQPPGSGSGSSGGGGYSGGNNPCLQTLPPSCHGNPVETVRQPAPGASRRRTASGWDPAAPAHAAGLVAHQTGGFSCPPIALGTPQLYLGGLHILDASLSCDQNASPPWTGTGELDLSEFPGGQALPKAKLTFHLDAGGQFHDGNVQLTVAAPLFAPPPVTLDSLSVGIATDPVTFSGSATIDVAGGLVTIDGGVLVVNADPNDRYTYSCTSSNAADCPLPGVQSLQTDTRADPIQTFAAGISGAVTLNTGLGSVELAHGYVFYVSPAYFEFAGSLGGSCGNPAGSLSVLGNFICIGGGVQGAADLNLGQYDVSGHLEACANFPDPIGSICPYLGAELSNVGIGGCGGIHALGTDWGLYAWVKWDGDHSIGFGGCDNIWPIHVNVQRSRAVRAVRAVRAAASTSSPTAPASGAVSFTLPSGLSSASVTVSGSGSPPLVAISGPHREGLSDSAPDTAAGSAQILIAPVAQLDQTLIGIKHPAGGRWTVTPLPGSAPLTGLDYTHSLPPIRIGVKVADPRARFSLRYHLPVERSQTITFIERSQSGVFHILGRVRGGDGTLRFTPALGPGGRREIVAVIAENGLPVRALTVGHYQAPPIPRAGQARRVRITRAGRALVITWSAAANARGYLASASLTDGRRLSYTLGARARRLSIGTLQPGTGGLVKIYGLGPTGVLGPAASDRLAPPPPPPRVTHIQVRRQARRLVISWRPAARAIRYLLTITISGAAPTVLLGITDRPMLAPRDASLMLARGASSLIQIRGVSSEGQQGQPGTLRFGTARSRRKTARAPRSAIL